MTIKLYHCAVARSIRPLWTLEEMGLAYNVEVMPFPPRFLRPGYLDINPLGTVPAMTDGNVNMTESAAMCQYLVDKYGPTPLAVQSSEPDYGNYLNWLHRSDATLTFPQTVVLRYTLLEPEERRLPQAVDDYTTWFFSRLRCVESATEHNEFLCADRFTIADICVGFALYLADSLKLSDGFKPNTKAYYTRLQQRSAFKKAIAVAPDFNLGP